MKVVAGATTLAELASALGRDAQGAHEVSIVAELKAGSEQAYSWLIAHYHQPVYSLVFRMVNDPADAADTTQEVFLKVFRGMGHFNGHSSLKTWIYRIAVHEAANRKRWWFRHKRRETSLEPGSSLDGCSPGLGLKDVLADPGDSPFDTCLHKEIRAKVEDELRQVAEPFRTAVILRHRQIVRQHQRVVIGLGHGARSYLQSFRNAAVFAFSRSRAFASACTARSK